MKHLDQNRVRFEVLNQMDSEIYKSIGVIKGASIQGSRIFVVAERVNSDGHNTSFYNNIAGISEEQASFYELAMPLIGIDLEDSFRDYSTLVGKYVEVSEKKGIAVNCRYLGEISNIEDEMIAIPKEDIFKARLALMQREEEQTDGNMMAEMSKQGYSQESLIELFKIPMSETVDKILLWDGDSYFQKDTGIPTVNEEVKEPPSFLKYLNKKSIKLKACHQFNKSFSGR